MRFKPSRIGCQALRTAIGQTVFAAATEESRPVLTGILAEFEEDRVTLAAADGFRLAIHRGSLEEVISNPLSVIIPSRALNELSRFLGDQEEPVEMMITPAKGQVMFRIRGKDTVEMVSQLLQGAFPNYDQLIPQTYTTRAILDLPTILRAARTAAIFARDGSNIIRMHVIPANGGGSGMNLPDSLGVSVSARCGQPLPWRRSLPARYPVGWPSSRLMWPFTMVQRYP